MPTDRPRIYRGVISSTMSLPDGRQVLVATVGDTAGTDPITTVERLLAGRRAGGRYLYRQYHRQGTDHAGLLAAHLAICAGLRAGTIRPDGEEA